MEHTDLLNIVVEKKFKDVELAIHPNDGEDLHLYTRDMEMELFAGQSIEKLKNGEGQIGKAEFHLLNECPLGTLMLSESLLMKINYSEEAIIIRNNEKMYLAYKEDF